MHKRSVHLELKTKNLLRTMKNILKTQIITRLKFKINHQTNNYQDHFVFDILF